MKRLALVVASPGLHVGFGASCAAGDEARKGAPGCTKDRFAHQLAERPTESGGDIQLVGFGFSATTRSLAAANVNLFV